MSRLYDNRGNLSVGFHGCRRDVALELLNNPDKIKISENDYDWLGSGFYIWENNMERAVEWAKNFYGDKGAVVGVVYELGTCLDLMDSSCINLIKEARKSFEIDMNLLGLPIPTNKDLRNDPNKDKILRKLDCAVINYLTSTTDTMYKHEVSSLGYSEKQVFDSVRGCFWEGAKIDKMEIYEKTHIQIAIRNMNCIKGIFLPRSLVKFP